MSEEISFLMAALQSDPENWSVRRFLATHYLDQGDEQRAVALVTTAPSPPKSEDDCLFAAQVAAKLSVKHAHQLLDAFLVHHAASPRAHYLKATLLSQQGLADKAEMHYKVARVLNPRIDEDPGFEVAPVDGQAMQQLASAYEQAGYQPAPAPEPEVAPVRRLAPPAPAGQGTEHPSALTGSHTVKDVMTGMTSMVALGAAEAAAHPEEVLRRLESEAMADTGAGEALAELVERQTAVVAALADTSGEVMAKPVLAERKSASEKFTAIFVAIGIHVLILVGFGLMVVALPRQTPPEIYAQAANTDSETDLQRTEIQKPTVQQTAPSAMQTPVITSAMFSDVAMPTVDVSAVSPLAGMGAEAGMDFGMSFGMPGGGSGMSNIPPSMAGRCSMGQRMARLKESGATTACEAAVRNALRFLRENQNEDGSFGKEYPAAMTGLSVLAFLGHCETPDSVEFGNSVTKATLYLMERAAKSEGDLVISADTNPRGHGVEYEHAITTYALCEMYTMTKASGASARIPRLESSMKKAVKKIIDAQVGSGPHEGGWAYGYGTGHIDTSVSGWNFQALKSATFTGESIAGLDKALDKAADYFKRAQQPNGGIPYKLGEGAPKPSLTPVGALVFEMWKMEDSKESAKAFEWLGANVLGKGAPQVYGWYYTQQAYFLEGGEPWKKWNQFAMEKILKTQQGDGSFNMSPGHGPKDPASAKVYMTTLCTLMLEVYYRYLPTTQKNLGGNRAGG